MNCVELFAGGCSFSKTAQELGHNTFTSDIIKSENIDYSTDIFNFDANKIPFDNVDILWASPPCRFFSVCSIGRYWNKDNTPKHENAKLGIKIIKKLLEIIDIIKPKYVIIENPRGKLRKLDLIPYKIHTVSYCKYGDNRMKPTDIWTNIKGFIPKMCNNGNPDHIKAPRGSKTGTQSSGLNYYDQCKIPSLLIKELLVLTDDLL